MQVALLHQCPLADLSKKFSNEEYKLWVAYVIKRHRDNNPVDADIELPQELAPEPPEQTAEDVERILSM